MKLLVKKMVAKMKRKDLILKAAKIQKVAKRTQKMTVNLTTIQMKTQKMAMEKKVTWLALNYPTKSQR